MSEPLPASELERLTRSYHEAIDQCRDSSLTEATRERALDATVDLRRQLDEDAIARARAAEAGPGRSREECARIVAGTAPSESTSAEVRDLFRAPDPKLGLTMQATIPMGELRTEYPLLTSDAANGYGSYAVPTSLPGLIVQSLVDQSGILQAGPTLVRSGTGEAMQVPTLGTEPTAAAYKTEGAAATETDAILSKVDITVGHIAGYLQASQEFLTDAAGDAEREIVKMCGNALGKALATQLATGTSHVEGVFENATTGVTAGAVDSFDYEDLIDLRGSVGTAYRGRKSCWIFSDAAYTYSLKLLDDNGHPLIKPGMSPDGTFDMLYGSPVYVDSYGPALTTGKNVVLYGRPDAAYWLRTVGGVEVTRSDEFAHTSWLSTFRFGVRAGGNIVDASALRAITLA